MKNLFDFKNNKTILILSLVGVVLLILLGIILMLAKADNSTDTKAKNGNTAILTTTVTSTTQDTNSIYTMNKNVTFSYPNQFQLQDCNTVTCTIDLGNAETIFVDSNSQNLYNQTLATYENVNFWCSAPVKKSITRNNIVIGFQYSGKTGTTCIDYNVAVIRYGAQGNGNALIVTYSQTNNSIPLTHMNDFNTLIDSIIITD